MRVTRGDPGTAAVAAGLGHVGAKDFRTWIGTVLAAIAFKEMKAVASPALSRTETAVLALLQRRLRKDAGARRAYV